MKVLVITGYRCVLYWNFFHLFTYPPIVIFIPILKVYVPFRSQLLRSIPPTTSVQQWRISCRCLKSRDCRLAELGREILIRISSFSSNSLCLWTELRELLHEFSTVVALFLAMARWKHGRSSPKGETVSTIYMNFIQSVWNRR